MLRTLALASLALLAPSSFAQQRESVPLERLARHSERILVVSVQSVASLDQLDQPVQRILWPAQEIPIAQLKVERSLVGPRGEERVFALAARSVAGKLEQVLKRGERAIVFLERDQLFERQGGERTRAQIAEHCGGARLEAIALGGLWKLDANGDCIPPLDALPLPRELTARMRNGALASLPLLHWTAQRIASELPWVHVRTDGLVMPNLLRVAADRSVHEYPHETPTRTLSKAEWDALWHRIDEADLFGLPLQMGSSRAPCLYHIEIEIRTRTGGWKGHVNFEKAWSPLEEQRLARVKPVYDAIARLRKQP